MPFTTQPELYIIFSHFVFQIDLRFLHFSVYTFIHVYPWWGWRKMDSSCFYAYHSEFYLVQLNTHTDFGDLMQQLDHRTWEGDWGFIHKQEGSDITAQQEVQKLGCLLNVLRLSTFTMHQVLCSLFGICYEIYLLGKWSKMADERFWSTF